MPVVPVAVEAVPLSDLPLPVLSIEAIPVQAIPVEPRPFVEAPVPPKRIPHIPPPPLSYPGYDVSRRSGRPGIITAIGVSSIIVASLSIIGGGVMMMFNLVVSSMARYPAPPAPITPTVVTVGPSELLGANGAPAADRAVIIDGLGRVQPLTEAERLQLDEMLAEEGKSVLALSGPDITPEQVAANVTRSGHLSTGGSAGSEYFAVGNGRLEVAEDRAVFFPTNGQPPLRSNAITIPAGPTGVLTPDQIRSVIRTINRLNNTSIKSAQSATIVQTLQGPGQQLISPTTDGSDPACEISAVSSDPDDSSLTLSTSHGNTQSIITLDPGGHITSSSTTSVSMSKNFPFKNGMPTFNRTISQWTSFLSGVQILLAVYLLVCGIFMLNRGSLIGRRLHWIYVGIKLPIAIATCAMVYTLWSGFLSNWAGASGGPSPGSPPPGLPLDFALPAAVGLIYPVVLLFVLALSHGVKTYFAAAKYAA